MPSTHVSLYYHIVFSTKNRYSCIRESWEERLHEYMAGIIRNCGGVADIVGGTSDHVHILASLKATRSLADIMREMKTNSSKWIHDRIDRNFWGWQDGYGAFTVSKSDLTGVRKYILRQKEHHRRSTFKEEYINILKQCGIEFDERYLW